MKTHIQLSSLFLSALLLTACASTARDPGVSLTPEHAASMMAINDNLIVPGERIGPIFIGMTEAELYKKMGDPSRTVRGDDGTWLRYRYDSTHLSVQVNPSTHKVNVIDNYQIDYFPYATREGVAIGWSELHLQTLPWTLAWKKHHPDPQQPCWTFQYTGIRIGSCDGKIVSITVHSPR
jgi:hypothetical protein